MGNYEKLSALRFVFIKVDALLHSSVLICILWSLLLFFVPLQTRRFKQWSLVYM